MTILTESVLSQLVTAEDFGSWSLWALMALAEYHSATPDRWFAFLAGSVGLVETFLEGFRSEDTSLSSAERNETWGACPSFLSGALSTANSDGSPKLG